MPVWCMTIVSPFNRQVCGRTFCQCYFCDKAVKELFSLSKIVYGSVIPLCHRILCNQQIHMREHSLRTSHIKRTPSPWLFPSTPPQKGYFINFLLTLTPPHVPIVITLSCGDVPNGCSLMLLFMFKPSLFSLDFLERLAAKVFNILCTTT